MKLPAARVAFLVFLPAAFFASSANAQLGARLGDQVANWTPAPSSRGIRTMADVTPLLPFVGVNPCRIVDTRGPAGPYGAPALTGGVPRNFALLGGPCTGLPVGVSAYSLNITVTNTLGPGFISIYPQGGAPPLVSTLNYNAGQTLANAAIVPAGTGGGVTVVAGVSGTDLIIDINGYFSGIPGTVNNSFLVSNNSPGYSIQGVNASTANFAVAVSGIMSSTSPAFGSAGVSGQLGAFTSCVTCLNFGAGVRGVTGSNFQTGILGISSTGYAVDGYTTGGTGISPVAEGSLGVPGNLSPPYPFGVYAGIGNIGCNGCMKSFIDPHPTDPSKSIVYVSLEGPEAGTYFRGTSRTVHGQAVIPVPDHFRWVTQEEGMTVQLTPVGELAMMAVVSQDLDRIVVRSSKDVAFHYLVQGIRPAFKDFEPVKDGNQYAPRSAAQSMAEGWTEWAKQRLIANGTYNPDGTVNMGTAKALGWDKLWAEREKPDPEK